MKDDALGAVRVGVILGRTRGAWAAQSWGVFPAALEIGDCSLFSTALAKGT